MSLQQTAINLIKKFGGEQTNIVVRRYSMVTHDPISGKDTQGLKEDTALSALKLTNFSNHWTDTMIEKASVELIVDSQYRVLMGDDILIDGKKYEIISIRDIEPSNVLYIQKVLLGG